MEKKFKTQVLTVSKRFLKEHLKSGQETKFREGILNGVNGDHDKYEYFKIHTIRGNRSYWKKAYERKLLLSVRQWVDVPYQSPGQEKLIDITYLNWGIQEITMIRGQDGLKATVNGKSINVDVLAANDGLLRADFEAWFAPHFKRWDVFFGIIIHFTDFRY